ncbi:hypothetical protein VOLCADRAFT_86608 [Volvox carteri f. nagariensis]|uniref:Metallo-beta-lactamase domain-containing protein n=1 Tax=Volvox carteri f. nagariensis TaxID=3068 RepID=D8TJ45_VOLCA|nr:uncharacterized protein VOLCADRAFT_86608 [Volvox carteri f. nagariensis]EFJ52312.1 hypothetical protein VOLCADRAFT_86608 [Volvox carteri f. nagariensis]|eukprot:XP_002946385.1 hypothetical protein VOLCADRAFT_86608 [Volvox carteri f. nagariensis]
MPATERTRTSFHHGITYTSYEVNTAGIKFNASGVRVLIDPWFIGELAFGGAEWLYSGRKRVIGRDTRVDMQQVLAETDVLVITQGLDDHCHIPTLSAVANKAIPVVTNPDGAARMRPLGFSNIRVLSPGESTTVTGESGGQIRIQATAGALVGPPWTPRQLGLLMREVAAEGERSASLYFESHCDFDPASLTSGLQSCLAGGPVDVVVSPVVSTLLGVGPASYELVQGASNLVRLLRLLRPKVLLPLLNHDMEASGPLTAIMWQKGDDRAVTELLRREGLTDTRVEYPAPPGEALALAL